MNRSDRVIEPRTVIVISSDASFRRLAGAALSRAGHEVRTMTARPSRIERVLDLHPPDVVVLDIDDDRGDEIAAHISEGQAPPGLVYVTEDGEETRPLAVQKWGPLDALVDNVGLALSGQAPTGGRPHLRVIQGGH